jgi:hypothetical protein
MAKAKQIKLKMPGSGGHRDVRITACPFCHEDIMKVQIQGPGSVEGWTGLDIGAPVYKLIAHQSAELINDSRTFAGHEHRCRVIHPGFRRLFLLRVTFPGVGSH